MLQDTLQRFMDEYIYPAEPAARMWREGRSLRVADGPDEVHAMVVARRELRRFE
jgi:alkylation response protein AidB-like acyl-CoA dehydrogenase